MKIGVNLIFTHEMFLKNSIECLRKYLPNSNICFLFQTMRWRLDNLVPDTTYECLVQVKCY